MSNHESVSWPPSWTEPNPNVVDLTWTLLETLKLMNMFQSEAEINNRIQVIAKVDNLFGAWMKTRQKKNRPDTCEGQIFQFGSFPMGVHVKGSDVDLICVAPYHVKRAHFFKSFVELLKTQPGVTNLRAVVNSLVPVVKLVLDGVELDIVFASLALQTIQTNLNVRDNMLLELLDLKCVHSMNGVRVTQEILELVPNRETFIIVLSAIKLWSKARGIYSNILGFLGGIAWTILVVKICRLNHTANPAAVIHRFFENYAVWKWPLPILLKPLPTDNKFTHAIWNSSVNKADLMPIITPVYPQQNCAYNVTRSTHTIIMEEFCTGQSVVREIRQGNEEWNTLFKRSDFFNTYKHFLVVKAIAEDEEQYLDWKGFIESRIRRLIISLDKHRKIKIAHICPTSYGPNRETDETFTCKWCVGLAFNLNGHETGSKVDLSSNIQAFLDVVYGQAKQLNLHKKGMTVEVHKVTKEFLPQYGIQQILNEEQEDQIRKRDSDRLSSVSTGNGLDGSASSIVTEAASSKPSSQEAEYVNTVAAAEVSEASQQSGNDNHSTSGPSAPDSESKQVNVLMSSSRSAAVSMASREDDSDEKTEHIVCSPSSQDSRQEAALKRPRSPVQNDTSLKKPRYEGEAAEEKVDQDYLLDEIIKSTGGDEATQSNNASVKDDGTKLEDLVGEAAEEKVDKDLLDEIKSTGGDEANQSNNASVKDDGTTLEDLVGEAAEEKVDKDLLDEIKSTGGDEANQSNNASVKDDGTTLEDLVVDEKSMSTLSSSSQPTVSSQQSSFSDAAKLGKIFYYMTVPVQMPIA